MSCKEEVIEVPKDGEYEIPQTVQESLETSRKNKTAVYTKSCTVQKSWSSISKIF
jgi:hypothetical protein